MHGALLLAKEARTAAKKLALADAGAIEKLVDALKLAEPTSARSITCILHALFNISTHPRNQVRTIKHGLRVILRHARGSSAGVHATAFATRILENCRHQPETVSMYYKLELRFKSRDLRRRAAAGEASDSRTLAGGSASTIRSSASLATAATWDAAADDGNESLLSGRTRKSEDSSKLQRFKSRFEAFLKDFESYAETNSRKREPSAADSASVREDGYDDLDSVDFWKRKHHRRAPSVATESMVATPKAKPVYRHAHLTGLGTEMSKSVVTIWGDKRPPSGASSTPGFSPRATWAPRITSTTPVIREHVGSSVQETPRKPGVFGLWRPLSRSDSSRFGSFLDR